MQGTCEERIDDYMALRVASITEACDAYDANEDADLPINTEALSIEVRTNWREIEDDEEGTWSPEKVKYIEIVLGWGGPGDFIRMYPSGKIDYHFQDWFDGAVREWPEPDLLDRLYDPEWFACGGSDWEDKVKFNGYSWSDGWTCDSKLSIMGWES